MPELISPKADLAPSPPFSYVGQGAQRRKGKTDEPQIDQPSLKLPPSSLIPETMADKMAGKLQIYADGERSEKVIGPDSTEECGPLSRSTLSRCLRLTSPHLRKSAVRLPFLCAFA